jgi:hypothetical protein
MVEATQTQSPAPAGNLGGGTNPASATETKPARVRKAAAPVTNPDTLTGAELEAFNKKPDWEKMEIRAKWQKQEAARMKAEAKASAPATQGRLPQVPAFTLVHAFGMLSKAQVVPPTDGGKPEAAQVRAIKDFGVIMPFLVTQEADGRYSLMDSRQYALIPDGQSVPAIVVSGFPSPEWVDAARAIVSSAKSANVLGLSEILGRLRQRGWDDKQVRTRLGLKAGEVEKYESISRGLPETLRAALGAGRLTPNVAMLIAKQSDAVKAALVEKFGEKTKADANAKLTEADVEEARKARAADAVKRDQPQLAAALNSTPAALGEAPQAPPAPVPAVLETAGAGSLPETPANP